MSSGQEQPGRCDPPGDALMAEMQLKKLEMEVTGCGPYSCCLLGMTIHRVRRLPGVAQAKVRVFPLKFLTKTLVVTYEPGRIAPEEICRCCEL